MAKKGRAVEDGAHLCPYERWNNAQQPLPEGRWFGEARTRDEEGVLASGEPSVPEEPVLQRQVGTVKRWKPSSPHATWYSGAN